MTTRNISIQLLSSLQTRGIFNFIPSSQYAMISHCVYNFHFPDDYWLWPCLFTTFIYFLVEYLFTYFLRFIYVVISLLNQKLYSLYKFLSSVYLANVYSQYVTCLFTSLSMSFEQKKKFQIWWISVDQYFSFLVHSFCIMSKKYLPNSRSQNFLHSSKILQFYLLYLVLYFMLT